MDFTKRWVTHLRSNHPQEVSVPDLFCPLCKSELPNMDEKFFRLHVHEDRDSHACWDSDEDIHNAFRRIMSTEPRLETQHPDRPHKRRELGKLDDPKTDTDHDRSNSDPEDDQGRSFKKRSSTESAGHQPVCSPPLASAIRSRARLGPKNSPSRQLWTDGDQGDGQRIPQSRPVPPAPRSPPGQTTRSPPRPPPHVNEAEPVIQMKLQPETKPISQDQLVAEVKAIYAGLNMVETKCIEVDNAQSSNSDANKLIDEQWQALMALHRTLLHEQDDFFSASQHPSASAPLRGLASKYALPARMWRHGIHSFLELLRHRLPASLEHMLTFLYLSYSMMSIFEPVPELEDTWIECLRDLGRHRKAIEDDDIRDREAWAGVSQHWYSKRSDKSPTPGRLYHHLGILARPNAVHQLYYYAKSLCVPISFLSARESVMTLFGSILDFDLRQLLEADTNFVRVYAMLFSEQSNDRVDHSMEGLLERLNGCIGRVTNRWRETLYFVDTATSCFLPGFGTESNVLMGAIFHEPDIMVNIPIDGTYALESDPNDNDKYCHRMIASYLSSKRQFRAICNQNGCQPLRPWHPNHSSDRNIGQLLNHDHTNDPSASRLPRQGLSSILIGLIWPLIWTSSLAGSASAWLSGAGAEGVSTCRRYWKRWNVDGHSLATKIRMEAM